MKYEGILYLAQAKDIMAKACDEIFVEMITNKHKHRTNPFMQTDK